MSREQWYSLLEYLSDQAVSLVEARRLLAWRFDLTPEGARLIVEDWLSQRRHPPPTKDRRAGNGGGTRSAPGER